MNRATLTMLLLVSGSAFPLAISAQRLASAQELTRSQAIVLHQTESEAGEIMQLRAMRETIQARPRPTQDVITQVTASLDEVGIPERAMKRLVPQSDGTSVRTKVGSGMSGDSPVLHEQTLQLVLEDLTPEQIGSWMLQWRKSQAIWTPTRLELVHNRASKQEVNRYDATILLTALYLDGGDPALGAAEAKASDDAPTKEGS